jgi:hypothetical protein
MKHLILSTIFLVGFNIFSYSQITTSEIPTTESNSNDQKPQIKFDSTQDIRLINQFSQYKTFIGQSLYMIPTNKSSPELYSATPELLPIDNLNDKLSIKSSFDYNFIYTNIYKPVHLKTRNKNPNDYRSYTSVSIENSDSVSNSYYTLLDVLYKDKLSELLNKWEKQFDVKKKEIKELQSKNKLWKNSKKIWVHQNQSIDLNYSNNRFSFKLLDEETKDTIYAMNMNKDMVNNFILVPYFTKQKKLYENQRLVFKGDSTIPLYKRDKIYHYSNGFTETEINIDSEWKCTEVTLLKPIYFMVYKLENESGKSLYVPSVKHFISNDQFLVQEEMRKKDEAKIALGNKIAEEKKAREEELKYEEFKRRVYTNYGEEFGNAVINHEVEIGMSKAMCTDAIGLPTKIEQIESENVMYDVWNYSDILKLFFIDDELKSIKREI